MSKQDRRSFLATLGGGVAALGLSRPMRGSWLPRKRLGSFGIQLYTLRRQAMADLPATLTQLAQIGYKEIEFWGTFPQKPPEIKQILDHNGLKSPSGHYGFPRAGDG